jgi:glycerol-3-phosphate dehydrogenase subunit B
MLIIGFSQFLDFYPDYIADNLNEQAIIAKAITLDIPSLQNKHFVSGMTLARLFDTPEFRAAVADALRPHLSGVSRLGFPAVLGLENALRVKLDLEELLGLPVFEIPGLPPSIPGMRLHTLLCNEITRLGGEIHNGMQVVGCEASNHHINSVYSEAAARYSQHTAQNFVLATGGILGGGVHLDNHGYAQDTALSIPIQTPPNRATWHHDTFLSENHHPLHSIGFAVTPDFQPLDLQKISIYDNLYAVGGSIGGYDPIQEHSLEGIALVTGALVGERLA